MSCCPPPLNQTTSREDEIFLEKLEDFIDKSININLEYLLFADYQIRIHLCENANYVNFQLPVQFSICLKNWDRIHLSLKVERIFDNSISNVCLLP